MKYLTCLLLMFALSAQVRARSEDRKLVMGSVYRVVKDLIEVQQEGSGIAVIKVDAATTYVNSSTKKPAKLRDIAVGDQIVITVVVKNGIDTAEDVKFVPALGSKN